MKVSMEWLNDYTDVSGIAPRAYAHALTMTGSKVEGVENPGSEISGVVAGRILGVEKHPNADSLCVCQVDVGQNEAVVIVTGAKNVKPGDLVPVALDGAALPGGVKIRRSKLRGVESCGMMCSHEELGMALEDYEGACEDGILQLLEDYAPGADVKQILGLDTDIVEFEITSNRPDCLSVIGLARETAVTFGRPLTVPVPSVAAEQGSIDDYASVEVHDAQLCPRYCARVVTGVKVGPSPKWLRSRLKASGIRSVNNIVDITNYVLLEYGQPMHAFDLAQVKGRKIIVRRAKDGETLTTLDGQDRALDPSMLVIADEGGPIAVAGVMGGANSEIGPDTSAILFESANFNGTSVRLSAKKLGMRTEASSRFEKGLDPTMAAAALERACQLVEQLACGQVAGGVLDVYPEPVQPRRIALRPEKISAFLGCAIDGETMKSLIAPLGFAFDGGDCIVPTFRADVEGEADLAEEVARIYGYDKIPSTLVSGRTLIGKKTPLQNSEDAVKAVLTGLGYYEAVTYSFTSPKVFDLLRLPEDSALRHVLSITNPLGEDTSVMRTTMVHSILDALARNYNFKCTAAKLFELGRIYHPAEGSELPVERGQIALGLYGDVDFYDLKGAAEEIFDILNVKDYAFEVDDSHSFLHPGRTARVLAGGAEIGFIGEVHPGVLKNYELGTRAYVGQLDLALLLDAAEGGAQYTPLPRFPAVQRDLAVLVDDGVPVAALEKAIAKGAGKLLEELSLFDVYKGAQVPQGKKSVAYALTLRAPDRTLTDEEISAAMAKVVKTLQKECGAQLR